jgi:hypothetical protein
MSPSFWNDSTSDPTMGSHVLSVKMLRMNGRCSPEKEKKEHVWARI